VETGGFWANICGTKDRTFEGLGSWVVQYWLARWLAEHTIKRSSRPALFAIPERLLKRADKIRTT